MKSVGGIFLITIFSFLLGFVRDLLIARQYGGGFQSDILFLSLSIPVLIENLLGVVLRDALIPYFKSLRASWGHLYQALVSKVGKYLGAISIVLVVPLLIFHDLFLKLLAPGWEAATLMSASVPFQIGALFVPFLVWSYFLTGILNASDRLVLPMARSVFLNLGCLAVLLISDVSIQWVLVGMLCGVVLHLVWMRVIVAQDKIVEGSGDSDPGAPPSLRSMLSTTAVPLFVSTVALQVTFIAERFFASWLDEGSISHLSYAYRITTVPMVIFSFSFVTVLFPGLVSKRVDGDKVGLRRLSSNGVKIALALMVPSAIFFAAFAEPIIRFLLERGEFGRTDTLATSGAVFGYAIGIPGLALSFMGARVAIATEEASVLIPAGVLAICTTIVADLLLIRSFGVEGLALACSAGATVQAAYLWWRIRRSVEIHGIGKMILRTVAAAGVGVALIQIDLPFSDFLKIIIGGFVIVLTFFFALWCFGEKRLVSPLVFRFREEQL